MTLNAIIKEIKNIPANRLAEVYQLINSLNTKEKTSIESRKKILSYSGAFKDMNDKTYKQFVKETKKTRDSLFDRTPAL